MAMVEPKFDTIVLFDLLFGGSNSAECADRLDERQGDTNR